MMLFHDVDEEVLIFDIIKKNILASTKLILSLGCGDCSIENKIANMYPDIILYCIDKEPICNKYLNKNLIFINADVSNYDFTILPTSFDYIYSFSLLQYLDIRSINILNQKLFSILKMNGLLVHFDVPNIKKKILYRINTIKNINRLSFNTLLGKNDFKDSMSRWIDIKKIKLLNNSSMYVKCSKLHFERNDIYVTH